MFNKVHLSKPILVFVCQLKKKKKSRSGSHTVFSNERKFTCKKIFHTATCPTQPLNIFYSLRPLQVRPEGHTLQFL